MALCTVAQVKTHLRAPEGTVDDAQIQTFIDAALAPCELVCGPVTARTVTETYDGGTTQIVLRRRPVISITSVTEYRGNSAYVLAAAANPAAATTYSYTLDNGHTLTRRGGGGAPIPFFPGESSIYVAYQAGRSSVPPHILQGALELIAHWWRNGQQAYTDQQGIPAGFTYVPGSAYLIPPKVMECWQSSRRAPRFA